MTTKDFFSKSKKALYKKFFLARVNERYIKTPAKKVNLYPAKSGFLLVAVFFNNIDFLRFQYASLSYLDDKFDYLVVDDSSDEDQSTAIESFCRENKINYVRLPENPGIDGSLCYGFALNWVYYNMVDKMKPRYFGTIDSDMFFISQGSILSHLGSEDYWGVKTDRKKTWYLYANFCVFKFDFLKGKKVNFLPEEERDTGGGNYAILKNTKTSHLMTSADIIVKRLGGAGFSQFFLNIVHFTQGGKLFSLKEENLIDRKEVLRRLLEDAVTK